MYLCQRVLSTTHSGKLGIQLTSLYLEAFAVHTVYCNVVLDYSLFKRVFIDQVPPCFHSQRGLSHQPASSNMQLTQLHDTLSPSSQYSGLSYGMPGIRQALRC